MCTKTRRHTKRAVILVGAGASIDFGAPSTSCLTQAIRDGILKDKHLRDQGVADAYLEIEQALCSHFRGRPNFEHIYHCAHEVAAGFRLTTRAADPFRPTLLPFLAKQLTASGQALERLCWAFHDLIRSEIQTACQHPAASLDPLAQFLSNLESRYIVRVYTTNYDDFLLKAQPDLYTGFDTRSDQSAKTFDISGFWARTNCDAICHLHGSVHLGFVQPQPGDVDLNLLHWFEDSTEALKHNTMGVSDKRRMDGTQVMLTPVVTGLDKLSHLQQSPFAHYYATLASDSMAADLFIIAGYGLSDLHINTWIGQSRRRNNKPPLILVDYYKNGFVADTKFETSTKTAEMVHSFRMPTGDSDTLTTLKEHWIVDREHACAIWDGGFYGFLQAPNEFHRVVAMLQP